MKALFIVGVVIVVAILTLLIGVYIGLAFNVNNKLKELGFNRESKRLYREAMATLNRMVRITELDGDFAADILSEETKKRINDLLARYRKEVNKT